jgi:hypothetical protein
MPPTRPAPPRLQAGKPFFGICLGLQLLFEGSEESGGHEGLGIIPGRVDHFDRGMGLPVPHIGWNTLEQRRPSELLGGVGPTERVYFVHSYRWGGGLGGGRGPLSGVSSCQRHRQRQQQRALGSARRPTPPSRCGPLPTRAPAAPPLLRPPAPRAVPSPANADWVLATSTYGEEFVAAVSKGSAMACQFHPEKVCVFFWGGS